MPGLQSPMSGSANALGAVLDRVTRRKQSRQLVASEAAEVIAIGEQLNSLSRSDMSRSNATTSAGGIATGHTSPRIRRD